MPIWLLGAIGFGFGLIIGSFLATILVRWPRRESVLSGRSHCDACGATLRAGDLVPLLAFLVASGRSRCCRARIDPRHPLVELGAGLVGLVAVLAHPLPLAAATALFGWWLLIAAALDAEHQWLPDALTLPLIPLGLGVAALELGPSLADRLVGAVAGFVGLWLIAFAYRRLRERDGLGGGDPKLLAGIGAWLGVMQLPLVLLGAGLLGLLSLLTMRLRGREVTRTTTLPLGTLMALAAWPLWLAGDRLGIGTLAGTP